MKASGQGWDLRAEKTTAEIDVFGTIGDPDLWEEGVSATEFIRAMRSIGRVSRININIHSVGGSAWDSVAMYRAIRDHQMAPKGEKVAHVSGLAASAATVVMVAADRVEVAPESQIMIHNPSGGMWGGEEEFRAMADRLKNCKEQILQIYQRRTGMAVEKLSELMDQETWMNGAEAKAAGFADLVKEDVPKARVAAIAKEFLAKFKNTPSNLLQRPPAKVSPEVAARLKKLGVV